MTPKWNKIITQSKIRLKHGSPTILTCLGAIGVVATSVLAIQATPKAVRKIRADSCINHDGDPDAYTKMEAFQSAWLCYIPASLVGMSTIACIFGANILNKHQQATITSAYTLLSNTYQDYERKTKEIFGEEGHQKSSMPLRLKEQMMFIFLLQEFVVLIVCHSANEIRKM